jgi:aspartate/methionine/tyrosine aminotransferase
MTRAMASEYMHWAKTRSAARYNLAVSGVPDATLRDLPVSLDDLALTTPGSYGYPPLQERLARRLGVGTDRVVAAAGTSGANYLALDALLAPGDEVLIEEPTYELLVRAAEHLGARVRRFARRAEDGFALDPAAAGRAATRDTRLIVITNLHNPSGALAGEDALREVQAVARGIGARVLVDEVYLETLYDTRPWRTACHLGPEFVATSSLTKAYGVSGLRCGWIVAEPAVAERLWRVFDLMAATGAHPAERLSVIALDHLDRLAVRPRALLAANHALWRGFLQGRRGLEGGAPEHGTVAFPRLKTGDADAFCHVLRERFETSVVPGRFFGAPAHFRVGLSAPAEAFAEGLDRLGRALDSL